MFLATAYKNWPPLLRLHKTVVIFESEKCLNTVRCSPNKSHHCAVFTRDCVRADQRNRFSLSNSPRYRLALGSTKISQTRLRAANHVTD